MNQSKNLGYLSTKEQKAAARFLARLTSEDVFPLSIILFGSKARGDYNDESDIDLLLVLPAVNASLRDHIRDIAADICNDFSTYLSTRVWSEAYFQEQARLETSLFQEIQADGIELLPFVV